MKNKLLVLVSIFLFASVSFAQSYVGPEKCLQCHSKKADWLTSITFPVTSIPTNQMHQYWVTVPKMVTLYKWEMLLIKYI